MMISIAFHILGATESAAEIRPGRDFDLANLWPDLERLRLPNSKILLNIL